MYWYKIVFFSRNLFFFFFGGGSFHALSAAGHAGGPRINSVASLGPARTNRRVLWAFKVAASSLFFAASPSAKPEPCTSMETPDCHCFVFPPLC